MGGAVFDRNFRERKFLAIDNKEFIPDDGSVTNAVTPYLGQGWDYYCTGGFVW